ncbi:saccharopine dehydrogenase family protein [Bacteroidota bacterium]
MSKVLVLGTGLVGSAIAIDLAKQYETTAIDLNTDCFQRLKKNGVSTIRVDLSIPGEISDQVADYDLVIGALPGFMGYNALRDVITAGKNMVDISFMPEDYLKLNDLAVKNGTTAVTDCGVAPGMGNLILGHHSVHMKVESFRCYVGGLPLVREWPYEYKAVFSPIDVIEEYTRPARYVKNGHLVTREALSDLELMNFPAVGTLEAWNSDGLRSLLTTMDIPDMIEKTLRYPGTTEYIKVLRETGFFSYDEITIADKKIRPIDFTSRLLFPKWKLKKGEGDLTVMKIIIQGEENGKKVDYSYDLYDEYDLETDTISMARTTGYTCTAVADLLLRGKLNHKGVLPPEYVGQQEGNFEHVMDYLRERGVYYQVKKILARGD